MIQNIVYPNGKTDTAIVLKNYSIEDVLEIKNDIISTLQSAALMEDLYCHKSFSNVLLFLLELEVSLTRDIREKLDEANQIQASKSIEGGEIVAISEE